MRKRSPPSLSLLALLAVGCSTRDDAPGTPESAAGAAAATSADAGDARQAIEAAMTKYVEAVKRGDPAAIVASYTDDAIVVMPSGPPMKGKAELNKGFADMLAASSVSALRSSDVERTISGDVAVETGAFEVTMQPKALGRETTDRGQYIVVWHRQPDGSWRMARAFNRADTPPNS
jgi:uncharacterized protein (TIGR02246 family)